jgi:hypothetical protein
MLHNFGRMIVRADRFVQRMGSILPFVQRHSTSFSSAAAIRNVTEPIFMVTARDHFDTHRIVHEIGVVAASDGNFIRTAPPELQRNSLATQ